MTRCGAARLDRTHAFPRAICFLCVIAIVGADNFRVSSIYALTLSPRWCAAADLILLRSPSVDVRNVMSDLVTSDAQTLGRDRNSGGEDP